MVVCTQIHLVLARCVFFWHGLFRCRGCCIGLVFFLLCGFVLATHDPSTDDQRNKRKKKQVFQHRPPDCTAWAWVLGWEKLLGQDRRTLSPPFQAFFVNSLLPRPSSLLSIPQFVPPPPIFDDHRRHFHIHSRRRSHHRRRRTLFQTCV